MDGRRYIGRQRNGHKDVVALLLDKMEGASIAATDCWRDKRRYIWRQGTGTRTWSRCCWTRWIADLIAATDGEGKTALHWAAMKGHKDVVALLLDKMDGASIAATD